MRLLRTFAAKVAGHIGNLVLGALGSILGTIVLEDYRTWAKAQHAMGHSAGPIGSVIAMCPPWLFPTLLVVAIVALALFAPPIAAFALSARRKPSDDETSAMRGRVLRIPDRIAMGNAPLPLFPNTTKDAIEVANALTLFSEAYNGPEGPILAKVYEENFGVRVFGMLKIMEAKGWNEPQTDALFRAPQTHADLGIIAEMLRGLAPYL